MAKCKTCNGTGEEPCPNCGGGGSTEWDEEEDFGDPDELEGEQLPCSTCKGTGKTECYECGGSGRT